MDKKLGQILMTGAGLRGADRAAFEIRVHSEQACRVFQQAFREALYNAVKAATSSPGGPVLVSLRRCLLGGKLYGKVNILNTFKPPVDEQTVRDLFSALTYTGAGGRPHLGSFIAGSLLRSIGGSAHCEVVVGPKPSQPRRKPTRRRRAQAREYLATYPKPGVTYFRTVLELPLGIWRGQGGKP
jgi:hypothetical protein